MFQTIIDVGRALGRLIHWCTGWLVHSDKGGCCDQTFDIKEEVKNQIENLRK